MPNSHPLSHILVDLTSNAAWRQHNHAFGPNLECALNESDYNESDYNESDSSYGKAG